jgi:sulfide:quinone oxidoreductase
MHLPLERFGADELIADAVVAVDDHAREVHLRGGGSRSFDALLVATGGRMIAGVKGATTWWPGGDVDSYGGLLRDIEEGYTKRIAIVVPPGAVWPLPAYELALMTAGEAKAMGQDDVNVTVVTPEREPLTLFGERAAAAVAEELRWAGVDLVTGAVPNDGVLERLDVERVFAVPRIVGPALTGLECDEEGFILTREDGRARGARHTWAAGDGIASPIKFGGVATQQARVAVAGIAREAGIFAPEPGEPVVHGRLLVGRRIRRLRGTGDGAPLWWPHGKVAGEHLPRWLARHGLVMPAAEAPAGEGITINRSLRALHAPEYQYLFELGRKYRAD